MRITTLLIASLTWGPLTVSTKSTTDSTLMSVLLQTTCTQLISFWFPFPLCRWGQWSWERECTSTHGCCTLHSEPSTELNLTVDTTFPGLPSKFFRCRTLLLSMTITTQQTSETTLHGSATGTSSLAQLALTSIRNLKSQKKKKTREYFSNYWKL